MRRGPIRFLGIPLALLANSAVWAQSHPNGFFLTSPLSLSAGYDDNFVSRGRTLDDTIGLLTGPTFSWLKTTHRSRFAVDYQPEFEMFSRYQELNAWNHSVLLRYEYQINNKLSFDAGDSYLSTSDASRRLAESQFLLPRGRFQEHSVFAGLKYRVDRQTVVFVRFDNAITALALHGPQSNPLDQMTNAANISLERTVTRHHSVTGSYAFLHVRPLDSPLPANSSYRAVHSLNLGYMYSVNPKLIFRVTGGVVRGREIAYTAGGAVERIWGRVSMLAGFQRYLSFFGGFAPSGGSAIPASSFGNGLLPDSVFQAASMRIRGKLTRRVGLELSGQLGRAQVGDRSMRSLIVQSRVDYRLNDRLTLFAQGDIYGQNLSQFSPSPLSRRRYFGGLEIVLSRPPEAEDPSRQRGTIPAESSERPAEGPPVTEEK